VSEPEGRPASQRASLVQYIGPASSVHVVDPINGELVELGSQPTDILAAMRREITDLRGRWLDVAKAIDRVITARLDQEGTRSARVGEFTVKTKPPTAEVIDGQALYEALDDLVERGVLSARKLDATVKVETVFKVDRRELPALRRHADQRVRDAVTRATSFQEQDRGVTVGRA
jgi:hypothetical protein